MRNWRLLERIEEHMARANLHMERGNELVDGVREEIRLSREEIRLSREEIRLSREEIRLSREQHADLRAFVRETNLRAERFMQAVMGELRALSAGQDDLREESRAQTQALLRVLDRLGPGPSPA